MGCVLAYNRALDEFKGNRSDLEVALEQARSWEEIDRLGRAVERLDGFLRKNPCSTWAYLTLAKLYDHPGYVGPDRFRALILYKRFIENRGKTRYVDPDLAHARSRVLVLSKGVKRPSVDSSQIAVPNLATFTCFTRMGTFTHVVYGRLDDEILVLIKVGDVDPTTGYSSLEMAPAFESVTKILRWIGGEESKKEVEMVLTEQAIRRVAFKTNDRIIQEEDGCLCAIHSQIQSVKLANDEKRKACVIEVDSSRGRMGFVFSDKQKRKAE